MKRRLRIIPLTITVACLLLAVKIIDVISGGQNLSESLLVANVEAKTEDKPEEKAKEHSKDEAKKDETKKEDGKETKKEDGKKEEDKKDENAKEGEKDDAKKEEHGEGAEKEADKNANPNVSTTLGDIADRRFSAVELELLQKLSKRREELAVWESNLQIKEAALGATEQRIDEKIAQVESLKKAVAAALAEYNKIEDAEIASLVKIYENMKPADAARIFNELERPILLLIVDRMSEKKVAPVLAAMDPRRAKMLTVDLAEQRRLRTSSENSAADNGNSSPQETAAKK